MKSLAVRDGLGDSERLKSLGPVGTSLGDAAGCIGLCVVSSSLFGSTTGRRTLVSPSVFTSSGCGLGVDSCFTSGSDFISISTCVVGMGMWTAVGSEDLTEKSGD